jgi:hypothetical protein
LSASRLRRASTRASISGQQTHPATVSAESNFRFGCYRNPKEERIAKWRDALERIRTARTVREARAIAEEALAEKPRED